MAKYKKTAWSYRLVQGILIGGGAILPGISGGVLCMVFGLYLPMMEILAHPKQALPKYWQMLIPVGIGWLLGFLLFAGFILWIFGLSESLATILFIGLIAGTLPAVYRQAGEQGRPKSAYAMAVIGFAVVFGLLLWGKLGISVEIVPNRGWFLFCGILWGLSMVLPGMTSSSILMSLGLFTPMAQGIASLDMNVIIPMLIGIVSVVITLSKLIHAVFQKYYAQMSYLILGIILASTVIIIPLTYEGIGNACLRVLFFIVGFSAAWKMERVGAKTESL